MTAEAHIDPDELSEEAIRSALSTSVLGRSVIYLPTTTSTMDDAGQAAHRGAPEGTLVLAEEQTGGRGRFQRTWVSPAGVNLYLSVVLRPDPRTLRQLGMVASLAVAKALRSLAPEVTPATIKWPNDVRIAKRKIAGILIVNSLQDFSIVGIGVNVNVDLSGYPEIRSIATSLRGELGRPVHRLDVLHALMEAMEGLYLIVKSGGSVRDEWASNLDTLGQQVRLAGGGRVYEGLAQDVDEEGSLLLLQSDGSVLALAAGEVTSQI